MSIRRQLALTLLVLLGLFAAFVLAGRHFTDELDALRATARQHERQALHLESVLRGVNESILTAGSPQSITTAEQAVAAFERQLAQLLAAPTTDVPERAALRELDQDWRPLKAALAPYLAVNDAHPSDESMIAYRRLLADLASLSKKVRRLAAAQQNQLAELSRRGNRFLTLFALVISLGVVGLFVHLYRIIAVPLNELRGVMAAVAHGKGELLARVLHAAATGPMKSVPTKAHTENEITALVSAFRFMLDNVRDHLVERQRTEDTLSEFNLFLEHRVKNRTRELQQTVEALRESEKRFRNLYEEAPLGYQSLDEEGRVIDVNQAWLAMLGYEKEEVIGRCIGDFLPGQRRELLMDRFPQPKESGDIHGLEIEMLHRNATPITVSVDGRVGHDGQGKFKQTHCILSDVTERKRAEEKLRLAATVFENTTEGVVITDAEANIIAVNKAFTEITGYPEDEVLGSKPSLLRSGRHDQSFYRDMWAAIHQAGRWRGEVWNRHKGGEPFPEWLTISRVTNEAGRVTHYVGVFSDISIIKESEQKLVHLAHHDALTDLPNRLLILERIDHAIARAKRERGKVALVYMDVDRFKNINDSLGHSLGDELLRAVAQRLLLGVREADTVGRLGGDEFIVILDDVSTGRDAAAVAQKLLDMFGSPFEAGAQELYLTLSIGISLFPDDGEDTATVLKNADAAMYQAKEQGRSNYKFYATEMTEFAAERVKLEGDLRRALERNELLVYYQPLLCLQTGALTGAEALLRWTHPQLGMVSPATFIPLAEETGLIGAIGEWVLVQACQQLRAWREAGIRLPRVSVNVAGPQIRRGDLVDVVSRALAQGGLEPPDLELEVTESFIMEQAGHAIDVFEDLRAFGVQVAIDDFGTGHSSLSYLRLLPIDRLKIDRSFVRDIPDDANASVIARAVVALGKSLQLKVTAEGVETQAQRAFLAEEGCDTAQGFLYSPPVPPDEFALFYAESQPAPVEEDNRNATRGR
jgi:diguanylate cyclase (GGDEF)-like protein/PAS domain S-box-containing protein